MSRLPYLQVSLQISGAPLTSRLQAWGGGGGGGVEGDVLPYMGYIGMCSAKGYGFLAVLV